MCLRVVHVDDGRRLRRQFLFFCCAHDSCTVQDSVGLWFSLAFVGWQGKISNSIMFVVIREGASPHKDDVFIVLGAQVETRHEPPLHAAACSVPSFDRLLKRKLTIGGALFFTRIQTGVGNCNNC